MGTLLFPAALPSRRACDRACERAACLLVGVAILREADRVRRLAEDARDDLLERFVDFGGQAKLACEGEILVVLKAAAEVGELDRGAGAGDAAVLVGVELL